VQKSQIIRQEGDSHQEGFDDFGSILANQKNYSKSVRYSRKNKDNESKTSLSSSVMSSFDANNLISSFSQQAQ